MRRSTVLSLPLKIVFLTIYLEHQQSFKCMCHNGQARMLMFHTVNSLVVTRNQSTLIKGIPALK
jgi:hypothetical protein